ncbi:uncharacterized protein LOC123393592 isoform X3 [Mustela putorius furo]|uniref:Uncharacterized protein LOC123393592 isoform X3 n=1 Tax=Mustela putorius furo TaxID=9669 RepID=A0A8U0V8R8_MUSPF|nr:uncharacterized protein LOC123393592 isoform X3 [Mustela putorius furo]
MLSRDRAPPGLLSGDRRPPPLQAPPGHLLPLCSGYVLPAAAPQGHSQTLRWPQSESGCGCQTSRVGKTQGPQAAAHGAAGIHRCHRSCVQPGGSALLPLHLQEPTAPRARRLRVKDGGEQCGRGIGKRSNGGECVGDLVRAAGVPEPFVLSLSGTSPKNSHPCQHSTFFSLKTSEEFRHMMNDLKIQKDTEGKVFEIPFFADFIVPVDRRQTARMGWHARKRSFSEKEVQFLLELSAGGKSNRHIPRSEGFLPSFLASSLVRRCLYPSV